MSVPSGLGLRGRPCPVGRDHAIQSRMRPHVSPMHSPQAPRELPWTQDTMQPQNTCQRLVGEGSMTGRLGECMHGCTPLRTTTCSERSLSL
jgi:hypothetical protein